MRFSVITLFPDWIHAYCGESILGRAQAAGVMTVDTANPRDFAPGAHRKVDDTPYGGGAGMVMMCQPIMEAYQSLQPQPEKTRVLAMSPAGRPLTQTDVAALSKEAHLIMLCGHYEGFDARLYELIPQLEPVSLGDFVLTGGELPALCIIDAVTRLLPGALGKAVSAEEESFSNGLLEYPQYTRPPQYEGLAVPPVLLSGHHGEIAQWRQAQSLEMTRRYRPDLLPPDALPPA